MRWIKKHKPRPKKGSAKVSKTFLLLPKCINEEVRWLEVAYITKQYYGKLRGWVPIHYTEEGSYDNFIKNK